jgi:peptidyl-prolyl cis-trans isomerase C
MRAPVSRARAAALLALALLATSCGTRESQVLARVGDRTITVGEFLDVARASGQQYPWDPDSNKVVLLDDMIQRELLLLEAQSRGMTADTVLGSVQRQAEEELLLQAMTARFAPENVPVSAAETERFYAWRGTENRVQLIVAEAEAAVRAARRRIEGGEPFGLVAMQFNQTGLVPPNGDVGFLAPGSMLEPLDSMLRRAQVGELLGPVQMSYQWVLARVMERREAELPPREAIEPQLQQQIRERKQRLLLQRAVQNLKLEYELVLDPQAATAMFERANQGRTEGSPPDEEVVLARYRVSGDTRTYTIADAIGDMQQSAPPNFTSTAAIARWIEAAIARRLVLVEARRRHLQEEPQVARRVEERVNNELLQSIYSSDVTAQLAGVTEADLRLEYERRAGPGAPAYESVPPELRAQLEQMTMEAKRDELLRRLTSGLRAKYPVTIDRERLSRVAWPTSPLQMMGG